MKMGYQDKSELSFNQILLIVFIPMVLGNITQRTFIKKYGEEKFKKDIKIKFQNLSTVGVLGIVFAAMALKSKTIIENPEQLLIYTAPIALLYTLNFMISTLVGKLTLDIYLDRSLVEVFANEYKAISSRIYPDPTSLGLELFAENGNEALDKYIMAMQGNEPFDAVIMDLTIPGGMGGKEAIARLKET